MLASQLQYRLRAGALTARSAAPLPKYGEAILAGADCPDGWDGFIGQREALERLHLSIASARARGVRLDHVLLASGLHGIGKTTLAKLVAHSLGVGFVEISGAVSAEEARPLIRGMRDGDVLFWDEIHQAVAGGKAKAEWLLHLLQGGSLITSRGAERMPDITVIAATTDAQRLPQTILSRFLVRPVLVPYSDEQGLQVAGSLARRMGVDLDAVEDDVDLLARVSAAANNSPREMKALLVAVRDQLAVHGAVDFDQALAWVGVTADGLDRLAQDYLTCLLVMCEGTAGLTTIAASLGEPGPLGHTEQLLVQKGLLTITAQGRTLTEAGAERAVALLVAQGLLDDDDALGQAA